MCNLIVSTTHNNQAMNEAVRSVAREYLDGREMTEGLLNHIEVAIRAYDPCLSCATHALGQMPLDVALIGPEGEPIDRVAQQSRVAARSGASQRGRRRWCEHEAERRVLGLRLGQPEPRRRRAGARCSSSGLRAGAGASADVEFLDDFQLQVEHALDLRGPPARAVRRRQPGLPRAVRGDAPARRARDAQPQHPRACRRRR